MTPTWITANRPSGDDFVNDGSVDNRAGHIYLTWSRVNGLGSWLGADEHAPLFQVTVSAGRRTADNDFVAFPECRPDLTNQSELGEGASHNLVDGKASLFAYQGFEPPRALDDPDCASSAPPTSAPPSEPQFARHPPA
ncbi:MAG: hypothetical protein LBC97_09640 [Bifidobacteriaceae bacterium]|jgi:hypothetical protein|nr:hypothetical protein [Bifidobacteriaceae bacterium]